MSTSLSGEVAYTVLWMLVAGVLLFSLVLVQAPVLLGDDPSAAAAALTQAPFVLAICALAMRKGQWRASTGMLLAMGYVGLLIVAAFRASYFGTITTNFAIFQAIQFSLIATLAAFAFLRDSRPFARRRYLLALCWAPAAYVAVNVLLHFAGYDPPGLVEPEKGYEAIVLNLLGISSQRVVFPMTAGFNGMAPTAAIAFAVSVLFALRGQHRKLAILGATASLYAMLATDSRGALLVAPLAVAVVVFTPRIHKRRFGWFAVALPVLPVLLALALATTADTPGAKFDRFSGSISTGTVRTIVWEEALALLSEPRLDHIFGYGQQGQVASGVSVGYAPLFGNGPDVLSVSVHNVVLQTALDMGWVGVACLIAVAAVMLTGLARGAGDPVYAALLAGTLAILFLGTVQASPTPYHPDSFAWWLMVVFGAVRLRELKGEARALQRARPS